MGVWDLTAMVENRMACTLLYMYICNVNVCIAIGLN